VLPGNRKFSGKNMLTYIQNILSKQVLTGNLTRRGAALCLLIAASSPGAAFGTESDVLTTFAPPIREVTVYPDRAMIIRSQRVQLRPGRVNLHFSGGSVSLDPQSLRAYSDTEDCVIQGISSHMERVSESANPRVRELEERLQTLENRQDAESKRAKRARYDLTGVERYAAFLATYISEHSTTPGSKSENENWSQALAFLGERRVATRKELQAADEALARIQEELQVARANLQKIQSAGRRTSRTIEISLQSLTGKSAEVSFSYVIRGASWNVSYGMYLEPDGQVLTEYYGNVHQETGEDWRNVKLSLSTATPSRGAQRPTVSPVYVAARQTGTRETFVQTEQAAPADDLAGGRAGAATTDAETDGTGGFAGVEASGESLVFQIPQAVDSPSSERRQRVTIAQFRTRPAELFYRIVPGVQETAHLAALVPNERAFPLLAGPVDAFRESGYTGRSDIEYTPAGSKFLAGFGVDRSMGVERSLRNYRESAGTLSSGRIYHTEITLEIRNRSDAPRRTRVYERMPVSDVEEVEVTLQSDTTGGHRNEAPGILCWEFELPARGTKQIKLHYRIRVPENYPGDLYGK
jgi:uncharacterized protein (TIGR02231 family)